PQGQRKITSCKVRFYEEKPNQKTSQARGPRCNQTDRRRNESEKKAKAEARQAIQARRNVGKSKTKVTRKCVCVQKVAPANKERRSQKTGPIRPTVSQLAEQKNRLKRREAIVRKQTRVFDWVIPPHTHKTQP
ncbi:hypothetical protein L873DRAFT_1806041, partial [Choiromyces venosus 120613-1]